VVLEDMDEGNSMAHPGLRWPSRDVSQSVRLLVEKKYGTWSRQEPELSFQASDKGLLD
jgi:hypothetical protein